MQKQEIAMCELKDRHVQEINAKTKEVEQHKHIANTYLA